MWFLGAVLGAILAAQVHAGLWVIGALLGAILGWSLGSRTQHRVAERDRLLEQRLQGLEARLDRLEQRSAASGQQMEQGSPALPLSLVPAARRAPAAEQASEPPAPPLAAASTRSTAAAIDDFAPRQPGSTPAMKQGDRSLADASPPGHAAPPIALERRASALGEWLTDGNLMARAGVVILFFGVAFLLKYGYQHFQVPIELRLTAVALAALVLLVIGWRLRQRRGSYALALQGGGIGLLYLTIFGALRLFGLLPAGPAFALLFAVAALSAVLAILQDALVLAVLGAAGGFLAPILASTGEGSHVTLFGFYAVLDIGILAIAWFKAWRLLNLIGFAFTFGIATVWGVLRYQPEHYASSEPFLVLFFLIHALLPVFLARRVAGPAERHLDTTLVFGLPLIAFALQLGLVREFTRGAAWSSLALGAFYLLLARTLWSRRAEEQRLLVEAYLALGAGFTTLAIPLAFDGRWTSAAWSIEGAALIWVGLRQQRLPARLFGILLQLLAAAFYLDDLHRPAGEWPLLNSVYLGALLLAVTGLFCAWMLQRARQQLLPAENWLAAVLLAWGVVWWVLGGLHEIDRYVPHALQPDAALLFFTVSCLLFAWLERRLSWPAARYPALALLPLMCLLALAAPGHAAHPFANLGYLAWPAAFAAHLFLLFRHQTGAAWALDWLHAAGLCLLAALGARELAWAIDRWVDGRAAWPLIGWALLPGVLLALLAMRGERLHWPVAAHLRAYLLLGGTPLALFLAAWFLAGNVLSDGDPWPLPYLPVLNPLDLTQAGALLVVGTWFVEARRLRLAPLAAMPLAVVSSLAGTGAFLWANAVLLRALHHWAGVPLQAAPLLRSELVQAALSLFWTLLALAAMVLATRRAWRPLWLTGAALLVAVVGKLLLVDLSNAATIERIVSFLGVGLLMLVIGYLAPLPPKEETAP